MTRRLSIILSSKKLRFIQSLCAVTAITLAGLLIGPQQVAQAQQNQTVCTTLAAVVIRPGDPTVQASTVATLTTLYTVPYTGTTSTSQCTAADTGAVWGLAIQRATPNVFYTSAVMMSGAGFGEGGSGGIYRNQQDKPASNELFVDLDALGFATRPANFPATNAARGLTGIITDTVEGAITSMFIDKQRAQVGRMSLGDIDISPTNDTLWTVNLFDRSLVRIKIPTGNAKPTAADVTKFSIPAPTSGGDSICVRDEYRPWGLKVLTDTVYVGVTCTDENHTGTEPGEGVNPDLRGVIYKYDVAGNSWTPLSITTKGQANPYFPLKGYRWDHDINSDGSLNRQYILVDLEIDKDGSFIVGLADRWPMVGRASGAPKQPWSQGDIVRICNASGTLTLEDGGKCDGNGHGPATVSGNDLVGYYNDLPDDPKFQAAHAENQTGGIALLPLPESRLVSMAYNPVNPSGAGNRSGFQVFDNKTGEVTWSFELVQAAKEAGYGKAGGLGDIEVLCDAPTADEETDEPTADPDSAEPSLLNRIFVPFVVQ
ncbi:MAG: hypothetical protein U0175_06530 [Caldilineaceae bacterium]